MSEEIKDILNYIGELTISELKERGKSLNIFNFIDTYFKLIRKNSSQKEILKYIHANDFNFKIFIDIFLLLRDIFEKKLPDSVEKIDELIDDFSYEYPIDEWFYNNKFVEILNIFKRFPIDSQVDREWEETLKIVFINFIKVLKKHIVTSDNEHELYAFEKIIKKSSTPQEFKDLSQELANLFEKFITIKKNSENALFIEEHKILIEELKDIIEILIKNIEIFLEFDASLFEKVKNLEEIVKELDNEKEVKKFKKILKELFFKIEFIKNSIEKEKDELKNIIVLMADTLKSFIGDGDSYGKQLDEFIEKLKQTDNIDEIKKIKHEIIKATLLVKEKTDKLQKALVKANNKILKANERLEKLEKELEQSKEKALYDSLTGIYNRGVFNDRIEKEVKNAIHRNKNLFLFILDVDNFKNVNDKYGHQTGDMVLKIIVSQTKKVIREVDLFARYGGEEFIILLPDISKAKALEIADRIRRKIEKTKFVYKSETFKVTVSIGITLLKQNDNVKSFIERADKALYQAKKSGKNKVVIL